MSTRDHDEADRQALEELLPWYAAGTLSRREAEQVEAALARDPELARCYELVCEELGGELEINEALGAPSARAMDALFARIDAEPVRPGALAAGLAARLSGFFASLTPRTLAWATSAAALVILLQAGVIGGALMRPAPSPRVVYETASGPGETAQTGAVVLVRFKPSATAGDIARLLASDNASIVSGPAPGGIYHVRVAPTALPPEKLGPIVQALQASPTVDFVAPATN